MGRPVTRKSPSSTLTFVPKPAPGALWNLVSQLSNLTPGHHHAYQRLQHVSGEKHSYISYNVFRRPTCAISAEWCYFQGAWNSTTFLLILHAAGLSFSTHAGTRDPFSLGHTYADENRAFKLSACQAILDRDANSGPFLTW